MTSPTPFKRGDFVRYDAQQNPDWPVCAKVLRAHHDGTVTVQARFQLDKDGNRGAWLGYSYRFAATLLRGAA